MFSSQLIYVVFFDTLPAMYVSILKQCIFVPLGMKLEDPAIFWSSAAPLQKGHAYIYVLYIIYIIIIIIIIQLFHNHTITSIIMYKNMLYLQVKIMLSQPFECLVSHALHFYGSWCLECPTEFSHGNDSMDWLKRKTTRGNHAFYH